MSEPETGAIELRDVTKHYRGAHAPAVAGLTLHVPAGHIMVLVGPSGCGKTTTLKMINRLVEPTSGSIVVDGTDITRLKADLLRRRMGYVIQGGGLFPHMSVAANIATVPHLLKWDARRISRRVDELLELVSLDPAQYRDRYPAALSGGQQQRVGVARALAADPPILLMDEPFGAVDPLTRGRLQDELLRIQSEVHKTIVCVTHDFDEALKLGDLIAIFADGAQVVQCDAPERILFEPASTFVEDFIGHGAGLKRLTLWRVKEFMSAGIATCRPGTRVADLLPHMGSSIVVADVAGRPLRWMTRKQLKRVESIPDGPDPSLAIVGEESTLNEALNAMLVSSQGGAVVTEKGGVLAGVIRIEQIMDAIAAQRDAAGAEQTDTAEVGEP